MNDLKEHIINVLERYLVAVSIVDPIVHLHSMRTGYEYDGPIIKNTEVEKLIERIKDEWSLSLEGVEEEK